MNKYFKLFQISLILSLAFLFACQNQESPVESVPTNSNNHSSFGKINLPAGATLQSAELYVFVRDAATDQTVRVHRVTSSWDENAVTWNNFGGSFDATVVDDFTASSIGWHSMDVTSVVQDWLDGTYDNFGFLLEQGQTTPATAYNSSEFSYQPNRPYLEICYDIGGSTDCMIIQRGTNGLVYDAYIWEVEPDNNFGSETVLRTGLIGNPGGPELEKQSLLRFDLEEFDEGCTRTQGYWKTHSEYGPAPYDETWALLPSGADTPFFGTGKTYYEIFHMPPRGGNAYLQLAHQWIAAELNMLAGTSIPADALNAFNEGTNLLDNYDGQINIPRNSGDRSYAVSLAEILEDYNSGDIGPGHCD